MDYRRELAVSEAARDQPSSSNRVIKKGLFSPASPASSSNISSSAGTRKFSLRPTEAGASIIYFATFFN